MMRKLRIFRLLHGKRLTEVARELRLPAYVVSAIERGEVTPSPRWVQRFEQTYGIDVARELLEHVDVTGTVGPATARTAR